MTVPMPSQVSRGADVRWDSNLETGHELVDAQHRELVAIFSEIAGAAEPGCDRAAVESLLIRLSDYVATHFAAEEDLMVAYGYPDIEIAQHRAEHVRLAGRTRDLVLEHRMGTPTVLALAGLLQEWIVEHISGHDRRLVDHIRATEATPQAG